MIFSYLKKNLEHLKLFFNESVLKVDQTLNLVTNVLILSYVLLFSVVENYININYTKLIKP